MYIVCVYIYTYVYTFVYDPPRSTPSSKRLYRLLPYIRTRLRYAESSANMDFIVPFCTCMHTKLAAIRRG